LILFVFYSLFKYSANVFSLVTSFLPKLTRQEK